MSTSQPETIGKFRIVSKLGQGGMGTVYRAVHGTLERPVALKILPPEFSNHSEYVIRFLREARTSATIQHKNVVQVYDAGEQDGRYYIAMEFIDGAHLLKYCEDKGKVSEEEGLNLLLQAASGLAAAHAKGLVHRDIKPENMLVGTDNVLRIVDFGLVMESASSTQLTATGACLGTPMYMSPEQADGEQADARTDIYSLAVSFFRVLTGQPPFSSPTVMNLLFKHKFEAPPEPRALRPDLSENVSNLLLHMLTKRRDLRPKDGQAVVEMIESIKRGEKIPAPPPHSAPQHGAALQPTMVTAAPVSKPTAPTQRRSYVIAAVALVAVIVYANRTDNKGGGQAVQSPAPVVVSSTTETKAPFAGPAAGLVSKGDSAFAEEKYHDALTHYRAAEKEAPGDAELKTRIEKTRKTIKAQELIRAAETLENDGQLDLAQERYGEAAQLEGVAPALIARERLERIKAQLDKAGQPVVQDKTRERDEFSRKASAAEKESRYEDAAHFYSRAASLSEAPLRATYAEKAIDCRRQDYIAKAVEAERQGNFAVARTNYSKALAIKPDDVLIAQKLDSVQRRAPETGQPGGEQQAYEKIMGEGQAAMEKGDFNDARLKFGIAIGMQRGPDANEKLKELEARELVQRGDDARAKGNVTLAKDLYEKAGLLSSKLLETTRARLTALATVAPPNAVVIEKAETLVRNKRDEDALTEVDKALHTDPGNRELKNLRTALENLGSAAKLNTELTKTCASASERMNDALDIESDDRFRDYKKAFRKFADSADERAGKIRTLFLERNYDGLQRSQSDARNDAADLGTELSSSADMFDRKADKASEKIGVKVPFVNVGVGGDKRKAERYKKLAENMRTLADQAKALRR